MLFVVNCKVDAAGPVKKNVPLFTLLLYQKIVPLFTLQRMPIIFAMYLEIVYI